MLAPMQWNCNFKGTIAYAQQSGAALENFESLLLLKAALSMGCEIEWAPPPANAAVSAADANAVDGGVAARQEVPPCKCSTPQAHRTTPQAPRMVYPRTSHECLSARARTKGERAPGAANDVVSSDDADDAACKDAVKDAANGALVLDKCAAPDVNDLTAWTPETWSRKDFSRPKYQPSIRSGLTWLSP